MRLLNADTLAPHEFFGSGIPRYAILSHTWGSAEEEVNCKDICALPISDAVRAKKGFQKIEYAAAQAKRDNLDWVWVDTCCIDKTSSAELTEAINSMYKWYQRSAVCYAYLSDVESLPQHSQQAVWETVSFARSRWFTRGWTLQELVAPRRVDFYTRDWGFINRKDASARRIWQDALSAASKVQTAVLFRPLEIPQRSVAQRMAWASSRTCTRVEDSAYSLLGLFDIHMPLLYGEEARAFERLQEHIVESLDDQSLFAMYPDVPSGCSSIITSILATSPQQFRLGALVDRGGSEIGEPSRMTKHGLRIQLPLCEVRFPSHHHLFWRENRCETFLARLNCTVYGEPANMLLLKDNSTLDAWDGVSRYFRVRAPSLETDLKESQATIVEPPRPVTMYIRNRVSQGMCTVKGFTARFSLPTELSSHLRRPDATQHDYPRIAGCVGTAGASVWCPQLDRHILLQPKSRTSFHIRHRTGSGLPSIVLLLGFGPSGETSMALSHAQGYTHMSGASLPLPTGPVLEAGIFLVNGHWMKATLRMTHDLSDSLRRPRHAVIAIEVSGDGACGEVVRHHGRQYVIAQPPLDVGS